MCWLILIYKIILCQLIISEIHEPNITTVYVYYNFLKGDRWEEHSVIKIISKYWDEAYLTEITALSLLCYDITFAQQHLQNLLFCRPPPDRHFSQPSHHSDFQGSSFIAVVLSLYQICGQAVHSLVFALIHTFCGQAVHGLVFALIHTFSFNQLNSPQVDFSQGGETL